METIRVGYWAKLNGRDVWMPAADCETQEQVDAAVADLKARGLEPDIA